MIWCDIGFKIRAVLSGVRRPFSMELAAMIEITKIDVPRNAIGSWFHKYTPQMGQTIQKLKMIIVTLCYFTSSCHRDSILLHISPILWHSLWYNLARTRRTGKLWWNLEPFGRALDWSLDFIRLILSSSSLVLVEVKQGPLWSGARRSIWPIW